jgi:hypothetical protein
MPSNTSFRLFLATVTTLLGIAFSASIERNFQIMNESGRRVEVHWIHPQTGEMVLQSTPDILAGSSFALNSYVGHTFQVRELPGKKTGVCEGESQQCRIEQFTVNSNSDQGEWRSTISLSSAFFVCELSVLSYKIARTTLSD